MWKRKKNWQRDLNLGLSDWGRESNHRAMLSPSERTPLKYFVDFIVKTDSGWHGMTCDIFCSFTDMGFDRLLRSQWYNFSHCKTRYYTIFLICSTLELKHFDWLLKVHVKLIGRFRPIRMLNFQRGVNVDWRCFYKIWPRFCWLVGKVPLPVIEIETLI